MISPPLKSQEPHHSDMVIKSLLMISHTPLLLESTISPALSISIKMQFPSPKEDNKSILVLFWLQLNKKNFSQVLINIKFQLIFLKLEEKCILVFQLNWTLSQKKRHQVQVPMIPKELTWLILDRIFFHKWSKYKFIPETLVLHAYIPAQYLSTRHKGKRPSQNLVLLLVNFLIIQTIQ